MCTYSTATTVHKLTVHDATCTGILSVQVRRRARYFFMHIQGRSTLCIARMDPAGGFHFLNAFFEYILYKLRFGVYQPDPVPEENKMFSIEISFLTPLTNDVLVSCTSFEVDLRGVPRRD